MQASALFQLIERLDANKAHPRHRLIVRTDGIVEHTAQALQRITEYSTENINKLLDCLTEWSTDYDFVVELGHRGCFRHLQRIMLDPAYADCAESMNNLAQVVTSHGFSIVRTRNILDDRIIDRLQPMTYSFDLPDGSKNMEALVKQVAQQQESQFTVGYMMWTSAVILARLLCRHPNWVHTKNVLEVGAGLGLAGIVAGRWASEVTLSDYNPTILQNLENNILINTQEHAGVFVDNAPIQPSTQMRVRFLDWDQLREVPEKQLSEVKAMVDDTVVIEHILPISLMCTYDVVIASDVVCQRKDAFGVVRALHAFLAPGGVAYIVLPSPSNRYGVDSFPEALDAAGFKYTRQLIDDASLTRDIEEAPYSEWHYFVVTR